MRRSRLDPFRPGPVRNTIRSQRGGQFTVTTASSQGSTAFAAWAGAGRSPSSRSVVSGSIKRTTACPGFGAGAASAVARLRRFPWMTARQQNRRNAQSPREPLRANTQHHDSRKGRQQLLVHYAASLVFTSMIHDRQHQPKVTAGQAHERADRASGTAGWQTRAGLVSFRGTRIGTRRSAMNESREEGFAVGAFRSSAFRAAADVPSR